MSEFCSVLDAITLLDCLHTQCHLMTPMALSNSEQVFPTAHFLPFALSFPDSSLLKLLSFPQAPVLCLPPSLSSIKKADLAPSSVFPGNWLTTEGCIPARPQWSFPRACPASPQRFCLSLFAPPSPYKRKPFSVWFWDTCRFPRSECFPYCDSLAF